MKWLDSRIEKPSSNRFDSYLVTFLYCESIFIGLADWVPKDGYKDGEWTNARCMNGNPLGGTVLYWMKHPNKPELR